MRTEIGVVFLFVAVAYATETPSSRTVNSAYDFHRRFGIPHAQKIKEIEDGIKSGQKIGGGSLTSTLSIPYQAGIIMTVLIFISVCSGALINENTVLTSARCYNDGVLTPTSITVVLGSNLLFYGGTRIRNDITVTVHPHYNPLYSVASDIAVLRIAPVTYSRTLQPIETPINTHEISSNYVNAITVASGYGIKADGTIVNPIQTISSTSLRVITNEECSRIYPGLIQNSHLCTSGSDGVGICNGDIGGPLVATVGLFRKILIGIGSFYATEGCQAGYPSGFTRVTSFLGWIHSV